jgi:hypothetical protein
MQCKFIKLLTIANVWTFTSMLALVNNEMTLASKLHVTEGARVF